jgi:phage tail protein X
MKTMKTMRGETFDSLALKLYGDEKYAANLLAENPDLCHLMQFGGGENVRIPDVDTEDDSSLPPWKRSA